MNYRKILLLLLPVFMCLGSMAQIRISSRDMKSGGSKPGLVYTLPRNYFIITVEVVKTEYYKGPYAQFASEMLGIKNAISDDKSSYSINSVRLSTGAEGDPGRSFIVSWDEAAKKTGADIIQLSEAGTLALLGNQIPAPKPSVKEDMVQQISDVLPLDGSLLLPEIIFPYFIQDNTIMTYDTVVVQPSADDTSAGITTRVLTRNVARSLKERAREAVEGYERLHENRFRMMTGYQEVAYEKESLSFMISEMKKAEDEYLSLFTGKIRKSKETLTFSIYPSGSDSLKVPVFRFSEELGVSSLREGHGTFVFLHWDKLTFPVPDTAEAGIEGMQSRLTYALPALVEAWVTIGEREFDRGKFHISQLGSTSRLPLREKMEIRMDPSTGAIETVIIH